jgi:hypothetical protein
MLIYLINSKGEAFGNENNSRGDFSGKLKIPGYPGIFMA